MGKHSWFEDKNGNVKRPLSLEEEFYPSESQIDVAAQKYLKKYDDLNNAFKKKTSLNERDMILMVIAAGVQCLRWALITNSSGRFDSAKDSDKFFESLGKRAGHYLPSLEDILTDHSVPYDATNTTEFYKMHFADTNLDPLSTGISGFDHRHTTLGHDPIAGFLFGTMNIATNTLTKKDFLLSSYYVENHMIDLPISFGDVIDMTKSVYQDDPWILATSFAKQVVHYSTDIFTRQGLPLPVVNIASPQLSRTLMNNHIDLYSVTRGIALSMMINTFTGWIHQLYYDPKTEEQKLYEVKTRKVITYSNMLSTIINAGYVHFTGDFDRLDIGGMMVTLWRMFNDEKIIKKIRYEFIQKELDGELAKEEDQVKQELAELGFEI